MYTVTSTQHNTRAQAPSTPDTGLHQADSKRVLQLDSLHVPFATRDHSDLEHATQSPVNGLRNVSLSIAHGERIVLLGPSGEGKTTLLRAVAGLSAITGGTVRVNGRDVSALAPEARGTVYLHQVPVLFPHLSVMDNVAFPLTVRGVGKTDRHRVAQQLLDRLGLGPFGNRLPHMLSGGQRHRVALARALGAQPHMRLLDEPLSALDPTLRRDVREAIRDAHDDSAAGMMLVTHDLDDATSLGDRIAVMLDRTIAQIASATELFARPASRDVMRFLGVHQELSGTMRDAHSVSTPFGVFPLPSDVAARLSGAADVTVGVRSDAIHCTAPVHGFSSDGATRNPSPAFAEPLLETQRISVAGIVERVHVRASASSATVRVGDIAVEAGFNPLSTLHAGDAVTLHIDARGIVAFAQ